MWARFNTAAVSVLVCVSVALCGCATKRREHVQPAGWEPESKYSGKTSVSDLGTIAFPTGEWTLEYRRIHSATDAPDYFVFTKVADPLERLTFLRHPRTTPARQLVHFLDTIGESMGDGIPFEEKKGDYGVGEIHPMRLEPATPGRGERSIAYSFIHAHTAPAASWLCHSYLFLHGGRVFVIVHASTSVISPAVVQNVHFRSEFVAMPDEYRFRTD